MKTYPVSKIFDKDWKVIYVPEEDEYQVRKSENHSREWHRRIIDKDGDPSTEIHRIGAPAIEHDDGSEGWYEFGEFHRIGGPAFIDACDDGEVAWGYRGKYIVCYEDYQYLTNCPDEDIIMFKLKYGEIE